jgi:hypothetical protein
MIKTTGDPACFVFSEFAYLYQNMDLFTYLRKCYRNCKIVYYLNNSVDTYLKAGNGFSVDDIKEIFDLVITYNKSDAERYSFLLAPPRIYTYKSIPDDETIEKSDVFYIGSSKGRLDKILYIYEQLNNYGLKCDFHIVGVKPELMKFCDSIDYNHPMKYEDVLKHVKRSKCVLNINEPGIYGVTLRLRSCWYE